MGGPPGLYDRDIELSEKFVGSSQEILVTNDLDKKRSNGKLVKLLKPKTKA